MSTNRNDRGQVLQSLSTFFEAEGEGNYTRRVRLACSSAIDTISGWSLPYMILGIPFTFLFFCFPALIVYMPENMPNYYSSFTSWEKQLRLSGVAMFLIVFLLWIMTWIIYRIGKRNRIKSYRLNQCMLLGIIFVAFYPIFYRGMCANESFPLRIFEWIFFAVNVTAAIISALKRKSILTLIFRNKLVLVGIILFLLIRLLSVCAPLMGTMELQSVLAIAFFVLLPDLTSLFLHVMLNGAIGQVMLMNDVLKDQERWRNLFGYTKSEWYGPKG